MIKNFMIFSERCSGSYFVQSAILENFDINYLMNRDESRHFFGHENDIYSEEEIESTLFVCVIRDSIEWIDSFFKKLHNIPLDNRRNIKDFINNEWYSIYESINKFGKEIIKDRNMITKARYKNIFDLRKNKNNYFLNLNNKYKNVLILKYEDLRDNYENTLCMIKNKYNLIQKNIEYLKIIKYKGIYDALYFRKPVLISDKIKEFIKKNVDIEQENKLGY